MSGLRVEHCTAATAAGSIENVHVAVYRGTLTPAELTSIHHAHLALLERFDKSAVLSVAEEGTPLPDAEVRELAGRYGDEVTPRVRCSSQVILGTGFWASAARSLITAMLWIRTGQYPVRVTDRIDDGCEFIAAANPKGPTAPELIRAVADLRRSR